MHRLPESLAAWGTPAFRDILGRELATLPAGAFELARCVREGDRVLADDLGFDVQEIGPEGAVPSARIGVFFDVQVACCSCGDEPVLEQGFAEFLVEIDPRTACARIRKL